MTLSNSVRHRLTTMDGDRIWYITYLINVTMVIVVKVLSINQSLPDLRVSVDGVEEPDQHQLVLAWGWRACRCARQSIRPEKFEIC